MIRQVRMLPSHCVCRQAALIEACLKFTLAIPHTLFRYSYRILPIGKLRLMVENVALILKIKKHCWVSSGLEWEKNHTVPFNGNERQNFFQLILEQQ